MVRFQKRQFRLLCLQSKKLFYENAYIELICDTFYASRMHGDNARARQRSSYRDIKNCEHTHHIGRHIDMAVEFCNKNSTTVIIQLSLAGFSRLTFFYYVITQLALLFFVNMLRHFKQFERPLCNG